MPRALPTNVLLAAGLLLVAAAVRPSHAQWLRPSTPQFAAVIDVAPYLNAYDLAGNPASLAEGHHPDVMRLRSVYDQRTGALAAFVEPGAQRVFQQQATVRRQLSGRHTVQGGFGVEVDRRSDWPWLATRDYVGGGPFLLGDSTTGATRYNALIMQGAYSRRLDRRWTLGASADYRVDHGLKQVSPRPTSQHRDVRAVVGAAYELAERFRLGAHVQLDDHQAEIRYRTDEGAVTAETRLLKFRGYDLPQVIASQTETRLAHRRAYAAGLSATLEERGMRVIAYAEASAMEGDVYDDLVRQVAEGYWAGHQSRAGVAVQARLGVRGQAGLRYALVRRSTWARHPLYDVLMSETGRFSQRMALGAAYRLAQRLEAGAEVLLAHVRVDEADHYGTVFRDGEALALHVRGGVAYRAQQFGVLASAAVGRYLGDQDLTTGAVTPLFTEHREADVQFFAQDRDVLSGGLTLTYDPGFAGSFDLVARAQAQHAREGYFSGTRRLTMSVRLSYLVAVF